MWLAVDPYFEKNYASEVWYEKRAGLGKKEAGENGSYS